MAGRRHPWSAEQKARIRGRDTSAVQKLAVEAAKASPKAGPFVTNCNAKTWVLHSPEGVPYVARNLMLWARENAELFGEEAGDPKGAARIAAGIRQIRQSQRGKTQRAVGSYKGWTLEDE